MRGLAPEFEGRVEFNIIPAEETLARPDEIASYGFSEALHGLVGFASDGEVLVKLPGHQFGEPEIRSAIETLLANES